jgi:cytochrome P450
MFLPRLMALCRSSIARSVTSDEVQKLPQSDTKTQLTLRSVQVTQTNPALHSKRPDFLRKFFKPITGGPTLFNLPEKDWKRWRAVFNRGFQNGRTMSLVPGMVEQTMTYIETLRELAAKGEMCLLEPPTLRFTIDMIGKNVV